MNQRIEDLIDVAGYRRDYRAAMGTGMCRWVCGSEGSFV